MIWTDPRAPLISRPSSGGQKVVPAAEGPIQSVVIAVLTYRRNAQLRDLLENLVEQARRSRLPAFVLVVDNNPDASSEQLVRSLDNPQVAYVHEPEPGIAAGRNTAIDRAGAADAIAFIDDDETPSRDWLARLLHTAEVHQAAAVTGPVVRRYPSEPSPLVHGMRRWDRVRRPTGSPVAAASTANLLLDLRLLRSMGLAFDPAFGLSGGSDTLLTKQLIRSGGLLVWCDEAVVFDHVTQERLTPRWIAGRGRRVGNTHARVRIAMSPGASTRTGLLFHGIGLQLWGGGAWAVGLICAHPEIEGAGRWRIARGRGIVDGALGRTVFDYRRPAHEPTVDGGTIGG